jgi:hypothetical protein
MKSDNDYNKKVWAFGIPIGEIKIGQCLGESYPNGYYTFLQTVVAAKKFDTRCKKHADIWDSIIIKVNSNYQIIRILSLKDSIRIQKLNQL